MSTDPYIDVKDSGNNISQTNYIELISVTEKEEIAILGDTPTVSNAVTTLAFGRGNRALPNKKEDVGQLVYREGSLPPQQTNNYSITKQSLPNYSRQDRLFNEYMTLTSNVLPKLFPCYTVDISSEESAVSSHKCAGDGPCKVDIVFVIDNYNRGTQFDNDCMKIINDVKRIANSNYRVGYVPLYSNHTDEDSEDLYHSDSPSTRRNTAIEEWNEAQVVYLNCDGGDYANDTFFSEIVFNGKIKRAYSPQGDYLAYAQKQLSGILYGRTCGQFRTEAKKVVVFLTTEYTAQLINYGYNKDTYDTFFLDFATSAANCGVQVVFACVNLNQLNPASVNFRNNGQLVASITNGLYIEDAEDRVWVNNGYIPDVKLYDQCTNFINNLCNISPSDECPGNNAILNGTFDTGLQGWTSTNSTAITIENKTAKISTVEYAGIVGITPIPTLYQDFDRIWVNAKVGDTVTLYFDIRPEVQDGAALPGAIDIAFVNDVGDDYNYSWDSMFTGERVKLVRTITAAMIGDTNYSLLRFMVNSPNNTNTSGSFACYLDNVVVCLESDKTTCRNVIRNSDFETGVDYWYISSESPPYFTQAPLVFWDSVNKALNVGSSSAPFCLPAETFHRFKFDILSASANGRLDVFETLIATSTKSVTVIDCSKIEEYPYTVTIQGYFTGPSFRETLFSNVIVKNVVACGLPDCGSGYSVHADMINEIYNLNQAGVVFLERSLQINEGASYVKDYNLTPGTMVKLLFGLAYNSQVIFDTIQPKEISDCPVKVELISDNAVDSIIIAANDLEDKVLTSVVKSSGNIRLKITALTKTTVADNPRSLISYYRLCYKEPPCNATISNVVAKFKWNGIPRRPFNIFNVFARITMRSPTDVYSRTILNVIPQTEGRSSWTGCNQWTRNDKTTIQTSPILANGLDSVKALSINSGNYESVANKRDYYWSIPFSENSSLSDELIIGFGYQFYGPIVESIEIFYLANIGNPSGDDTAPEKLGPFVCSPDPAQEYEISIEYNGSTGNKVFSGKASKNNLYPQNIDFESVSPNKWDSTAPTTNNGLRGEAARWQSVRFDLDLPTGGGLDQCTPATEYKAKGIGYIQFEALTSKTRGTFKDPCDAAVIIEETTTGESENSSQSVVLPGPTGGSWSLTIAINSKQRSITLPYNINAATLQTRLEQIDTIQAGNVTVTGSGKSTDPFTITFMGSLAGVNVPLMIADGTGLIGSASAVVSTITTGTPNERQVIRVPQDTMNDLVVGFNGSTSVPIRYNASVNEKRAAIEAIPTIGFGNVTVSGWIDDPTLPYVNDIIIDFSSQFPFATGPFALTNVPEITVTPSPPYAVTTLWEGGIGVNEVQHVKIYASGGTFRLTIYDPADTTNNTSFITGPINYNATSAQVKDAIIAADFLTSSEVSVTDLPSEPVSEGIEFHGYVVEFTGAKARTNFYQTKVDTSTLIGGKILVKQITIGGSVSEKQRLTILKANDGYFRLLIEIDGASEISDKIVYNTTEEGLQEIIAAHSKLESDDVVVKQINNGPNPDVVARFDITFKRYGNIPLMEADFGQSLLCNPRVFEPALPPPYQYPLTYQCEDETLSCQSGPKLTRPCRGESPLPSVKCDIRESANIARWYSYHRDLFAYNERVKTIRDLAVLNNKKPSEYVPYIRNQVSRELTSANYTTELKRGMSIVLIRSDLDTEGGRLRIINHLCNGDGRLTKSAMISKTVAYSERLFGIILTNFEMDVPTEIGKLDLKAVDLAGRVYAIMVLDRTATVNDSNKLKRLVTAVSADYGYIISKEIDIAAYNDITQVGMRWLKANFVEDKILPSRMLIN